MYKLYVIWYKLTLNFQGRSLVKNVTVEGTESLGRFGHSVTNLGDLNGDECDGQYFCPVHGRWIYNGSCCILQISQSVLHLIKMEKCLFTMDLKAVGWSILLHSRQVPKWYNGAILMMFHWHTDNQTITAEQMINQVTNLSAINVFGFSLDGKVDVDGNQYRGVTIII